MTRTAENIIRELVGADAPAKTVEGFKWEIHLEQLRWRTALDPRDTIPTAQRPSLHARDTGPAEKRKIKELANWASLSGLDELATALNAVHFPEPQRGRPYDWHRFYFVLQLSDIYERAGGRIGLSMDGGRARDTGFFEFATACAREVTPHVSGIDGTVRKVLEYRRLHLKK